MGLTGAGMIPRLCSFERTTDPNNMTGFIFKKASLLFPSGPRAPIFSTHVTPALSNKNMDTVTGAAAVT